MPLGRRCNVQLLSSSRLMTSVNCLFENAARDACRIFHGLAFITCAANFD